MSRRKRAVEARDAQQAQTTPAEETTRERETTAAETQLSETTTAAETPAQERETQQTQTQQRGKRGRTYRNARGGAPTRCTPELAEAVASYIREIGFVSVAIGKAGLTSNVHYEWMQKGEEDIAAGRGDSPFAVYATTIKNAQAEFQYRQLRVVQEGKQGWQSRAWMLERSDPQQYAIRQRVEHSGRVETGTAPVLSPAEYESKRQAILGDRQQVH